MPCSFMSWLRFFSSSRMLLFLSAFSMQVLLVLRFSFVLSLSFRLALFLFLLLFNQFSLRLRNEDRLNFSRIIHLLTQLIRWHFSPFFTWAFLRHRGLIKTSVSFESAHARPLKRWAQAIAVCSVFLLFKFVLAFARLNTTEFDFNRTWENGRV